MKKEIFRPIAGGMGATAIETALNHPVPIERGLEFVGVILIAEVVSTIASKIIKKNKPL